MKVIKIESGSGSSNKPAVFVDGGIHAREWISPVFVNNMINKVCYYRFLPLHILSFNKSVICLHLFSTGSTVQLCDVSVIPP